MADLEQAKLTDEEIETCYQATYKRALEWAKDLETSLNEKNWNPNRPADRERYFCSQFRDWIARDVAEKAQSKLLALLTEGTDLLLENVRGAGNCQVKDFELCQVQLDADKAIILPVVNALKAENERLLDDLHDRNARINDELIEKLALKDQLTEAKKLELTKEEWDAFSAIIIRCCSGRPCVLPQNYDKKEGSCSPCHILKDRAFIKLAAQSKSKQEGG